MPRKNKMSIPTTTKTTIPLYKPIKSRPLVKNITFVFQSITGFKDVGLQIRIVPIEDMLESRVWHQNFEWVWNSHRFRGIPTTDDIDIAVDDTPIETLKYKVYDDTGDALDECEIPMTIYAKQQVALQKQQEELSKAIEWDFDEDEPDYLNSITSICHLFVRNTLSRYTHCMDTLVGRLKKAKELEGKECPVLHTALTTENARQIDSCKHWISQEALDGMVKAGEGGPGHKHLNCPLCRERFHSFTGVS